MDLLNVFRGIKDPDPASPVDVVVDTFHVTSKSFAKQLTVELHYQLDPNDDEEMEYAHDIVYRAKKNCFRQSSFLHKITIRLVSAMCPFRGSQPGVANRSRYAREACGRVLQRIFIRILIFF